MEERPGRLGGRRRLREGPGQGPGRLQREARLPSRRPRLDRCEHERLGLGLRQAQPAGLEARHQLQHHRFRGRQRHILLLVSLFAAAGFARADTKLVIKGSDTLGAKLVPTLKEAYAAKNPGVSFEIAAEGSTTGIAAITDGTAQIGMSSRRATTLEMSGATAKGVTLRPTIVAHDGIAIVVNANNPIAKLSKREVERIFAGEVTDWSGVGGKVGKISVYTRNTSSGTYKDFKELAMNKRDYVSSSQKMAGNEQIVAEVAKNPNGIGYVGMAYMHTEGIKVVAIDGLLPTKDTVQSHKYAYARPTFYYTNGEPTGEAAKFLEFTLSDAGQKIAEDVGFVSIR
ncbi:MAG: phosphate ABC transporter substrate-binding protein [Verrucomicrobia bacterium]|nr:phosphate ABC transporter substrate-binding protein [Verrucomicrobiota bacterium]